MTTHRLDGQQPPSEGELLAVTVADRKVVLLTSAGTVYALDDECTHQKCSLSTGEVEGTTLVCPCHFAEYDVRTGEVLGGPAPAPLRTYSAKVVDGQVELDVAEE